MKLARQPKVPDCPKNLNRCVLTNCPEWKCWAYEKYEFEQEKKQKQNDAGWE